MPRKKSKKVRKEIDWAVDPNFDKNRSIIYVEHTYECPIYQEKAEEFLEFLTEAMPERMFALVRNDNGKVIPRPGSFEISISQNARTSLHDLWSGLSKGPPRRDKFPNFMNLLPEVRKIIKKFYSDAIHDLDDEDDQEERTR